jgi:hypothetical protein
MDLNQMIQQSLGQLTGASDQRVQALERQAQQMRQETARIESLGVRALELDRQAANTAAEAAAKKAATDYQVNSSIQRIDDIFAVDPDQNNSVIQSRMAEYTAAETTRKAVKQEYDQLTQTSFLNNPIGYILNQIQLPQVAARHNALVDVRDAAIADISTRQRLAQAQRSVQLPNVAEELKATALLQANRDRQVAEANVVRAEAELASKVAGLRLQAFQLGDKAQDVRGDTADRLLRFASLEEQRKNTAAQQAATQEAREARLAQLKATLDDKARRNEAIANINGRLATVGAFMGIPVQAAPTVESLDKLGNQKAQNAWYAMSATGALGATPAEAVDNLETYGNPANMSVQNPLAYQGYQGLKAALGSFKATIQMQSRGNPALQDVVKKRETLNAYASSEMLSEYDQSANSMAAGGARLADSRYDTLFNPYRANHKILLDGKRVPQNNTVVTAINAASAGREAQIASMPNIPAEVEVLALQGIIGSVAKGVIGVDEAAQQITQYYQAGIRTNLEAYQYTNFGVPAQRSYVVRLPALSMFGDPIQFDASNLASTKAALAKAARANMSNNFPAGFTGIPSPVRPGAPAQ